MSYCNTNKMLKDALKNNYAVGAFNFYNLETAQAIVSASEKLNVPVILQASESACNYAGMENLVAIVKSIANKSKIEIALHLDHGANVELCKKAIDCGFSSVMIDLSTLPFEDNIKGVKKVVSYAKKHNVSVEAELGEIKGVEDDENSSELIYTNPQKAKQFVEKTGIDSLAVAIGTAHGINKGTTTPKLKFEILEEIKSILPNFPLVCHGASNVPQEYVDIINNCDGEIKKAQGIDTSSIKRLATTTNIVKINMDTDIRLCFTSAIKKYLKENKSTFNPRSYLGSARTEVENYVYNVTNKFLH